eukprot:g4580.t1
MKTRDVTQNAKEHQSQQERIDISHVSGSCLGDVATQNDSTSSCVHASATLAGVAIVFISCLCSPLHLCLEGFLALELLSLFTTTMSLSAMHFECYAL